MKEIVGFVRINMWYLYSFKYMLLPEWLHQYYQAVIATESINGLRQLAFSSFEFNYCHDPNFLFEVGVLFIHALTLLCPLKEEASIQWYVTIGSTVILLLTLTLMLLMANFVDTKWCKHILKQNWLKPWHMGTCTRVLSTREKLPNKYQHDRI